MERDWLFYVGALVGGGCAALSGRYSLRVYRARSQIQALLKDVAGAHARVVVTGATGGIGREIVQQSLRGSQHSLAIWIGIGIPYRL